MDKGTCSVDACDRPAWARRMCSAHYERARKGRDLLTPIEKRRPDAICAVDECDRKHYCRGWCQLHYKRWAAHGDPEWTPEKRLCEVENCGDGHFSKGYCRLHYKRSLTGALLRPCPTCGVDMRGPSKYYCSDECHPKCRIVGCPRKTMGNHSVCTVHNTSIKKSGRDPVRLFAAEKRCVVCGVTEWEGSKGGRKYCSNACRYIWDRYKGEVPESVSCGRCGDLIDLTPNSQTGKRRYINVTVCNWCRSASKRRHKTSPKTLADRDGSVCGICKLPVDLALKHPHPESPSVDHVIPFSRGGSHDPENLQLAHLLCNIKKSDKIELESAV